MKRIVSGAAVVVVMTATSVFAASIGINTDSSQPDASAMLDVKSSTSGFLPPRMTAVQRAAIVTPATGLIVYQTDGTMGLYSYNGSAWVQVGAGSVTSVSGTAPVSVATGTTTPAISMAKATASVDGYLAAADFTTFAAKGGGSVTSVSGTAPISVANGTTTPAITLGTVGVANGGTGAITLAANNVLLGNGTSALQAVAPGTSGNVLTSNGTTWASSAAPSGLPTQTANAGKYLVTDGSAASWTVPLSIPNNNTKGGLSALNALVGSNAVSNTALGSNALKAITGNVADAGSNNTAVGYYALTGVTEGAAWSASYNTAVGTLAGAGLTTGDSNVSIGYQAMSNAAAAAVNQSVAVGIQALNSSSGNQNTAVGGNAMYLLSSGGYNVGVGRSAGNGLSTGSYNTYLGTGASGTSAGTNQIVLGAGATATANNQAVLGGDGTAGYMPAITQMVPGKDANASLGSATKRWTGLYLSAPLAVSQGGSGAATLATNNVLLGNGTSALQAVAPGTPGNVLTSDGTTWASTAPSGLPAQTGNNNKVLTTDGTSATWNSLTIANGGTGTTNGSITGTSALIFRAGGTGQNVTITPSSGGYTLLNGNVGIGTQWPGSKLSVVGDSANGGASFMSYFNSNGTLLRLGRFRGTYAAPTGLLSGDLIGSIIADAGVNDMFSTMNTSIDFYAEENYSSSAAGSRITFSTTNNATTSLTEKMRITNAGNVGIGTTTPNHKLEVNGTFAALAAINPQTAGYTLAATDNNKFITMDSTGAMTLTLPLNASVAIPVGFQCTIAQKNSGTVTIASSATMITTATTKAFKAKGSAATIIKTGTDEWMLFGDMN